MSESTLPGKEGERVSSRINNTFVCLNDHGYVLQSNDPGPQKFWLCCVRGAYEKWAVVYETQGSEMPSAVY